MKQSVLCHRTEVLLDKPLFFVQAHVIVVLLYQGLYGQIPGLGLVQKSGLDSDSDSTQKVKPAQPYCILGAY